MKILQKSILAFVMVIIMSGNVFGAVDTNASSWAKDSIQTAYDLNIVPDALLKKMPDSMTRKELCLLVVYFYRAYTGESGTTLTKSPFYDATDNNVAFVYEKGIMSGVTGTSFAPNGTVTRQDLAVVLFKTLEKSGANTEITLKQYGNFVDMNKIDEYAQSSVNKLSKVGVISGYNGYFKPDDTVTVEQAVIAFSKAYDIFQNYDFEIGGKKIAVGESVDSLRKKLGQPDRIDWNQYGFERYVYNKDYHHFVMVGIYEDKVAEIYTNSKNFSFKGITSETTRFDIENAVYEDDLRETATVRDSTSTASVYFDKSNDYVADAIYIKSNELSATKSDNIEDPRFNESMSLEIFDIVNASRVQRGLKAFKWDKNAVNSAINHSNDMKENKYLEYSNQNGADPFDRMEQSGVDFTTAAETIAKITGDSFDVYNEWFRNAGARNNMMSKDMTHAGVGISTDKFDIYATMDIFHP